MEFERAYESLSAWCRERDYAGHDPFDALNSRLFQATPLRHSRLARLVWTQAFKRSPINLRTLARVPAEKNPKGMALFALAALSRFRTLHTKETERESLSLLGQLMSVRLKTRSGAAAWGYNFDWQGRAFFAPRGTPTVVPTAFATRALIEAARALEDESYLKIARSVCEFILNDLNRSDESEREVCFSYSPLDTTRVFNASLLAGEVLASVGALTKEDELKSWALRAARYVVSRQRADGSWAYGAADFQTWADNFHTAFILTSLARIMEACTQARAEFSTALKRGYDFWRTSFFLAGGWPKYYHHHSYPADAHTAGASIVALAQLRELDADALPFAEKIAAWSLYNLRDHRGFFYYQRRRFGIVRTPYMRWTQAWMLYALARLIETLNVER